MAIHKLTDSGIRNAPPGDYQDGGGLTLVVKNTGTASWKFRYQRNKVRKRVGLGPYPTVTLAVARAEAEDCRRMLSQGLDPKEERAKRGRKGETFEDAAYKLFELKKSKLKDGGKAGRWMSTLEQHVFPHIGNKGVADLTVNDLVEVLRSC